MSRPKKPSPPKSVEALTHPEAKRTVIPTAEYQAMVAKSDQAVKTVTYTRGLEGLEEEKAARDPDLDPQLVWRGKDRQDWSDLVVNAPPLYIQEKVHPKVLIEDLRRHSADRVKEDAQIDLFADFNGIPEGVDKTDFYQHEGHWSNRMILGDSLQVMASLAEREGLRGKVQCIYLDPPYGIKFNSNFQWSTTSRDVKDGNAGHITREPEQVKAFRDTWRDGIHSYLTYLRDRLTVARDLLTDSGSIFVQIGDENVHRVRAVMDEVFGEDNCISLVTIKKTGGQTANALASVSDYLIFYAKNRAQLKFRQSYVKLIAGEGATTGERYDQVLLSSGTTRRANESDYQNPDSRFFQYVSTSSHRPAREHEKVEISFQGRKFLPPLGRTWTTTPMGLSRLISAGRIHAGGSTLRFQRFLDDFAATAVGNLWIDVAGASDKVYIVQTASSVIERCILMATDPGDLVLDPTCGSGTTAYVAEQWGRRWITIDTSRVALALARARIMGARYPFYLLADSREGQLKEAEITRTAPSHKPTYGNVRHGFVYERVPHITLKSIANNAEIDVIWEEYEQKLATLREQLSVISGQKKTLEEWEIPREMPAKWPTEAEPVFAEFWRVRIARQKAIDASIAAKADYEYLYDKPYQDNKKVRVAGPFTVESLSPHRMLGVDENDEIINQTGDGGDDYKEMRDFASMILENLKTSGVQQAHKEDRITFASLNPWPGNYICAEATFATSLGDAVSPTTKSASHQSPVTKRAGIFIGPEFGTVSRVDLVAAAREAADADFDVLIACAFNYEAHTTEFEKLGRIPVLKARMNADLHMADDLKNTGKGNLFVIFGEPDIDILQTEEGQIQVKVNGVDVFDPSSGEVRSDGPDGIACWFIDTDYNEESFFVRQAYFLGANDPYKALKNTLRAEIDEDAWATLHSDTSRPFDKPKSGRVAVKVINHLGDEVMKVFRVG